MHGRNPGVESRSEVFVLEDDRVRFALNKRRADAAGLTIRSQLLRVARPFDGMMLP